MVVSQCRICSSAAAINSINYTLITILIPLCCQAAATTAVSYGLWLLVNKIKTSWSRSLDETTKTGPTDRYPASDQPHT